MKWKDAFPEPTKSDGYEALYNAVERRFQIEIEQIGDEEMTQADTRAVINHLADIMIDAEALMVRVMKAASEARRNR